MLNVAIIFNVPPSFWDMGAREWGYAGAAYVKAPRHFSGNMGDFGVLKTYRYKNI